jgi:hypothetical protein
VIEMAGIKMVDFSALGDGVIDSGITGSDFGGFIEHGTGRIIGASPGRWLRSKIVPNGNLQEPSVSCSSRISIISNQNKHIDSR